MCGGGLFAVGRVVDFLTGLGGRFAIDFSGRTLVDIEFHLTTETVGQIQQNLPLCVEPETPVREVFRLLKLDKSGSALICRQGMLVGIFTERDAVRMLAAGSSLETPVQQVMVRNPVSLRSHDTIATAIKKMTAGGYRRLPIVDAEGRPQGKITISGIVHYLVEHFPKAVYNLPPVSQPAMQQRDGA